MMAAAAEGPVSPQQQQLEEQASRNNNGGMFNLQGAQASAAAFAPQLRTGEVRG